MPKENLTDRGIRAKKPAPDGKRIEYWDTQVPGLGLRINHKAKASATDYPSGQFIFSACFQKGGNPCRRTLGEIGGMTLEAAREKARDWRQLIKAGKDPAEEEGRQRLAEARRRKITFEAVAEDFIREKLPGERKGDEVARDIRRDLVAPLGKRPITDIQRIDIRDLIKAKKRTAPGQARNLLGYAKRLFSWAVAQEVYGLNSSPCSEIKANEIIGERPTADRNLSDDEIFALWRVARRMPYPYGPIYQLLMLNGLRLNEVADAQLSEFDFRRREWTIPAARMKGKNGKARPHVVPLTDASLQIIGRLPDQGRGPFLFSTTAGRRAVWVNSKVKARVDKAMLRVLKALAQKAGEEPAKVRLPHWVNHDIRRSVRTNLSPLKTAHGFRIPDEVKETILAHVRPGIRGVYDRYDYLEEKLEALSLWADRLHEIVGGGPNGEKPSNVIQMRRIA